VADFDQGQILGSKGRISTARNHSNGSMQQDAAVAYSANQGITKAN